MNIITVVWVIKTRQIVLRAVGKTKNTETVIMADTDQNKNPQSSWWKEEEPFYPMKFIKQIYQTTLVVVLALNLFWWMHTNRGTQEQPSEGWTFATKVTLAAIDHSVLVQNQVGCKDKKKHKLKPRFGRKLHTEVNECSFIINQCDFSAFKW